MNENHVWVVFLIMVLILGIFFGGEPDLMDAIIKSLGNS